MAKDKLQPDRCAEMLAALAAPERLKIVRFLADGPQNVTDIAEMLAIPAVNVSHHLTVLKIAKLIRGKKAGRFVHYSLCPGVLDEAVAAGIGEQALNLGCCKLALPLGFVKREC
jgi:DNA-binding transcriptional ArsR family regulator